MNDLLDQLDRLEFAAAFSEKEREAHKAYEAKARLQEAKIQEDLRQRKREVILGLAEPLLEALVRQAPERPLTARQIDRAVAQAELARRRAGAVWAETGTPETYLAEASARPNARLRARDLGAALDDCPGARPTPRL